MISLDTMMTETMNPSTTNLDTMNSLEIVTAMNAEDTGVALAVKKVLPQIATTVDMVVKAFQQGGRLIYMGSGTSGRLGLLDAVECPPTFGTNPDMVIGLISGGSRAFVKAVEGAEDSEDFGEQDLKNLKITPNDIVIGIAASGRTPYVIAGLNYAHSIGCRTVAISCNANSQIAKYAAHSVEVVTGPEVVTGSTRLKAGTAQKMVLNMISTGAMVRMGKVYKNYMVDVQQTNAKLKVRAENIIMALTNAPREEARTVLDKANGSVKTAIVMILLGVSAEKAEEQLEKSNGHVRKAIK